MKYNSTIVLGFCSRLQGLEEQCRVTGVLPCPTGQQVAFMDRASRPRNCSLVSMSSLSTSKEVRRELACSWSWERRASREHLTSLALIPLKFGIQRHPIYMSWNLRRAISVQGSHKGYSSRKTCWKGCVLPLAAEKRVVSGDLFVDSAQQESTDVQVRCAQHPEHGKGCQWPPKRGAVV